ncbi:hypothetical protein K438DRAFT_716691 [Mycena galopus ATCC 62051]|nr:hypothetical protein K438DRAFT_716691 [Mycena galopus ATCC 62051]
MPRLAFSTLTRRRPSSFLPCRRRRRRCRTAKRYGSRKMWGWTANLDLDPRMNPGGKSYTGCLLFFAFCLICKSSPLASRRRRKQRPKEREERGRRRQGAAPSPRDEHAPPTSIASFIAPPSSARSRSGRHLSFPFSTAHALPSPRNPSSPSRLDSCDSRGGPSSKSYAARRTGVLAIFKPVGVGQGRDRDERQARDMCASRAGRPDYSAAPARTTPPARAGLPLSLAPAPVQPQQHAPRLTTTPSRLASASPSRESRALPSHPHAHEHKSGAPPASACIPYPRPSPRPRPSFSPPTNQKGKARTTLKPLHHPCFDPRSTSYRITRLVRASRSNSSENQVR